MLQASAGSERRRRRLLRREEGLGQRGEGLRHRSEPKNLLDVQRRPGGAPRGHGGGGQRETTVAAEASISSACCRATPSWRPAGRMVGCPASQEAVGAAAGSESGGGDDEGGGGDGRWSAAGESHGDWAAGRVGRRPRPSSSPRLRAKGGRPTPAPKGAKAAAAFTRRSRSVCILALAREAGGRGRASGGAASRGRHPAGDSGEESCNSEESVRLGLLPTALVMENAGASSSRRCDDSVRLPPTLVKESAGGASSSCRFVGGEAVGLDSDSPSRRWNLQQPRMRLCW